MTSVLPYTFTSNTGTQFPKSGLTYFLPPVSQPLDVVGHINRMQDAMQDIQEADGVYLTSAGDSLYRSYAEITATFDFFSAWLRTNGNKNYFTGTTDDRAATLNAVADFMQYVIQGGLGTLSFTTPPTSTYTSYAASAVANGDYTVEYLNGSTRATIQISFMIPTAMWTAQPGSVLIPCH